MNLKHGKQRSYLFLVYIFIPVFGVRAASRPMPCFGDSDCKNIGLCLTAKKFPACMESQCKCLDQKPECLLDFECATQIDCGPNKPDHDKYCHGRRCHCHTEVECSAATALQCPKLTGCRNAVCDNGHCHPTERDLSCVKVECIVNLDCAKLDCGLGKPDHDKYCHKGTCHCHKEVECSAAIASQCPKLTGCRNAICENGHCHPTERDSNCVKAECTVDLDCAKLDCGLGKPDHDKYCHKGTCHCHKEVECIAAIASQCPKLTGCRNAVCENGHCHPTERDSNCVKAECTVNLDCAKLDCGLGKPDHDKYCHKGTCHCHKEVECNAATSARCPALTGCINSVCEQGHCHPTERDANCAVHFVKP